MPASTQRWYNSRHSRKSDTVATPVIPTEAGIQGAGVRAQLCDSCLLPSFTSILSNGSLVGRSRRLDVFHFARRHQFPELDALTLNVFSYLTADLKGLSRYAAT